MNISNSFEDLLFKDTNRVIFFWWQFGDEGKGKWTSQIRNADRVAAATGGGNAWHTIYFDNGQKAAFHELPGWSIIDGARVYLWQWRVISVPWLEEEINVLETNGVDIKDKVVVAGNAHIVLPLDKRLDGHIESIKGKSAVWTTKKGIWTTYANKALRIGITVNQLLEWDRNTIDTIIHTNAELRHYWKGKIYEEINEAKRSIENLINTWKISIDKTNMMLNQADRSWKRIIIEHSQSALLAIDGWAYPFCTSSDTSVNGVFSGVNVADYGTNVCVMKAIPSKVWAWYFPTKIEWKIADRYRKLSDEFGATTGRPRDIWWFDTILARNVLAKNHTDWIIFTKADMLHALNGWRIKIAEYYTDKVTQEKYTETLPYLPEIYKRISVKYTDTFNITKNIGGIKQKKHLPLEHKKYFDALLDLIGFDKKIALGTWPWRNDFLIYNK